MTKLPTLAKNYLTIDGDVLDKICWLFYGKREKVTEAVIAANPIVLEYGTVMPAGIILVLPPLQFDIQRKALWDYVQPVAMDLSLIPNNGNSYVDALEDYRNTSAPLFVGQRVDVLRAPPSEILPVLVGDQLPPNFSQPPLPSVPDGEEAKYVAVYYRGPDNTFKVGYITREEFDTGSADEIYITGSP